MRNNSIVKKVLSVQIYSIVFQNKKFITIILEYKTINQIFIKNSKKIL